MTIFKHIFAENLEGNNTDIKVLDKISSKNILVQLKNGQDFKHKDLIGLIPIIAKNDLGYKIKGICFNSKETILGDYAKINTLNESYKIRSESSKKVKILIDNDE